MIHACQEIQQQCHSKINSCFFGDSVRQNKQLLLSKTRPSRLLNLHYDYDDDTRHIISYLQKLIVQVKRDRKYLGIQSDFQSQKLFWTKAFILQVDIQITISSISSHKCYDHSSQQVLFVIMQDNTKCSFKIECYANTGNRITSVNSKLFSVQKVLIKLQQMQMNLNKINRTSHATTRFRIASCNSRIRADRKICTISETKNSKTGQILKNEV
ncbi:unnamed protein product [Paramecium octaurelia]|uniref:Uncharacterized protein n=1 Tax=Paramecium octaurelia TaxID=43137 RepID=A0A8S1UR86_PAROT|nr:unnamed protein product [Paramecium octaurelia]